MSFYSLIDPAGNIVSAQIKPHPGLLISEGFRLLPDNAPGFDPVYQVVQRVVPVLPDATEVPYAVFWKALEELKAIRTRELKTHRDSLEASGFPYSGKTLDSDPRSAQRITTAAYAAQMAIATASPFSIDWTTADNSVMTLTAEEMAVMPVALAQYANALHQTCKALKQQIADATSAEAVVAITWPAQ